MTETTWASLRALLVERYGTLRRRLAHRLGSMDLAAETLQETWLRLERPGNPGPVQRPEAYLFRVALNIAADRRDADRRRLALSEIELLLHADDDELDPERITAARNDVAVLVGILDELPPRCRAIFVAARFEELPHKTIAARFGISTRMVERELKRALEHCDKLLGKSRFGSGPPEPSME